MDDGVALNEGKGQGLLLQAGGRAGGRGLEAVPAFEGGESDPGYVVVAGDEGQSVSRDSAVAPGSAGGGRRGEGGVVGLTTGPPCLTPGYLAQSHRPGLAQEVVSPAPVSPLITDLQVETSQGAGRAEGVNP